MTRCDVAIESTDIRKVRGRSHVRPEQRYPDGGVMLAKTEYLEIIVESAGIEVRFRFATATELIEFMKAASAAADSALIEELDLGGVS